MIPQTHPRREAEREKATRGSVAMLVGRSWILFVDHDPEVKNPSPSHSPEVGKEADSSDMRERLIRSHPEHICSAAAVFGVS